MSDRLSRTLDPPRDSRRAGIWGLAVAIILICAALFLIHVLRNMGRVQDCVMSGRTNCAPIETP
ncbi:MAG: hypothetical protein JO208_12540 [Alphaproteobacteria bacterium]|nr:hypothetical protein [Alphaproteobacteria bacterium]